MKRCAFAARLLALGALPGLAAAAGFDCAKAKRVSEQAICANAELSRTDDALSAAWRRSIEADGDSAARKVAQRDWLRLRDACGSDVACLARRYAERLAVLGVKPVAAASAWRGSWQRASAAPGVSATLTITGAPPNLSFALDALNGANSGNFDGALVVDGEHAIFKGDAGCRLDFARRGDRIAVTQSARGDCGVGAGVYYGGEYATAAAVAALPRQTLLTLGVVTEKSADNAARSLLGDHDYQTLLESCNVIGESDDLDHQGAHVADCFVRGIANTNAAIVISKRDRLWIGPLVFAADDTLRLRYYTNVAAAKGTMPTTLRHWLDDKQAANAAPGSGAPRVIPVDRQP